MKKLKLFGFLLSSLVIILMTGCQKEPSTSFSMSKTSIKVGETVSFTNTTSDGDSYEWSFGDGQTSTSASPTHTFNTAGTFTITLTAYSKNGKKKDKATATLTVIQTTDLALTVYFNGETNTVDDCLVQLFTTQTDWDNYTNVVVYGNTDYNGQITFTDLQPIVYYVDAYREGYSGSGYYSNWDLGYITNSLVANTINYYNIYVEYTAKKSGSKLYKIVKVEPTFPGDENAESNIMNVKRKNFKIEVSGNELKK